MNYMLPFYNSLLQHPYYPFHCPSIPPPQLKTCILINNPATSNSEDMPKPTIHKQSSDSHQQSSISRERVQKHQPVLGKLKTKQKNKNRDESFGWRKQNKERNILSTILKGYVGFVLQEGSVTKIVQSLSSKLSQENAVSRFVCFIRQVFPNRKSYVGIKYMKDCLRKKGQDQEMRLTMAVTLRHYLREILPMEVVKNSLLRKKERQGLLKKIRCVHKTLFQQM